MSDFIYQSYYDFIIKYGFCAAVSLKYFELVELSIVILCHQWVENENHSLIVNFYDCEFFLFSGEGNIKNKVQLLVLEIRSIGVLRRYGLWHWEIIYKFNFRLLVLNTSEAYD